MNRTITLLALALALPWLAAAQDLDVTMQRLGEKDYQFTWQSNPSNPGESTLLYYAFQLQGSSDLENWVDIGTPIATRIGGGSQTESFTVNDPEHNFFRLAYRVDLSNQAFPGSDFSGLTLSGANLAGADFSNADLSGANLLDAQLQSTNLNGANLDNTKFSPTSGELYNLNQFGGLGGALVVTLPDLPAYADVPDFADDVPGFENIPTSQTTLIVQPKATTTIAQLNGFLAANNGTVAGTIGQPLGLAEPFIAVRFNTTATNVRTLQSILEADPLIESVLLDVGQTTTSLPSYTKGRENLFFWNYGVPDDQAIWSPDTNQMPHEPWGHLWTNIPAMWNFNDGVQKLLWLRGTPVPLTPRVVVLDGGIDGEHPDLQHITEFQEYNTDVTHGSFVSGIVGAEFTSHRNAFGYGGMEGVDPYANLYSMTYPFGSGGNFVKFKLLAWATMNADCRVINMSLGIPWHYFQPDGTRVVIGIGTRPDLEASIMRWASKVPALLQQLEANYQVPLIVKAAGNDQINSCWGGPINYHARIAGSEHILVVAAQRYRSDGIAVSFSNRNPDVLAPGANLTSTIPFAPDGATGGYDSTGDGTSYAAPYITALASYLLKLNPDLTNQQLKRLITQDNVVPTEYIPVADVTRMDAFASVMLLDTIAPPPERMVLEMLLDCDDGTPDGNLRQRFGPPLFYVASNPPTVTPYEKEWTTDITDPGGRAHPDSIVLDLPGDGVIDMSDFRKWRDHRQFAEEIPGIMLDGGPDHPKLDANLNGVVDHPSTENRYARTDFNGDGLLTPSIHPVTGKTDFDILVESGLWNDPHVTLPDLPFLIQSGDLRIVLTDALEELAPFVDTMDIVISGGPWNKTRTIDLNNGAGFLKPEMRWNFHHRDLLVTLPVGTHTVRVDIYAPPPATDPVVTFERSVPIGLCEDKVFMVDYPDVLW